MSPPTNILEVRYGSTIHRYPVASASFLAVRYSGGFGIVIVVTGEKTKADPDPDPAISPIFSMVLPMKEFSLEVGTLLQVGAKDLRNTDIKVIPMFADWDLHVVSDVTVTVVERTDEQFHLRCIGRFASVSTMMPDTILSIDARFEFRGIVDHDETSSYPVATEFGGHMRPKGNWLKYITDEVSLQSGTGPVTEYEWLHTDRFRRLIGKLFEMQQQTATAPAASGVRDRLRRLFRRTSAESPTSIPERYLPTPTLRQTKLLLAASLEQLLPDELCCVVNITTSAMARVLERYADNEPTAEDGKLVTRLEATMYYIPGGMIRLTSEDVTSDGAFLIFRMPGMISPGMMGDLFVWRLVPERSRMGCDILKCLFGNPYRPVRWLPEWRTANAIGLARAAYELQDYSRLPILADALQDAGCEQEAILSHCRDTRIHARGCWVLDAILQRNGNDF